MKKAALAWMVLLVVAMTVPAFAADATGIFFDFSATETFTERAPGVADRAATVAAQAALNANLVERQVVAGLEKPLVVRAAPDAVRSVLEASRTVGRLPVGVATEMDFAIDFADFVPRGIVHRSALRLPLGALGIEKEGFVWTGSIASPGAKAMRLHLTGVSLPVGVELYVYNERGEARGPYAARQGEIWTHTLLGEQLHLQLRYGGGETAAALADTRFHLSAVGHLTERFVLGVMGGPAPEGLAERAFCSFNEPCVENAACQSVPGAIAAAEDAVAEMLFASGQFLYICTGGLLADTDASTQIPYFLTANHCIGNNSEASSLETFFQFTTNCNGSCYNFQTAGLPGTVGSTIASGSGTSDYTLLQLSQAAPAGSAFLGWNSTAVAFSNGTNLYRLSHPGGAPQAYSRHSVDTSKGTCGSWPRGNWIYSHDTLGATEGGSSGSPVLNGSGQVVGQLSGACGFNVNDPCDSNSNATVDGAFAAYFNSVSPFLDPSGGPGPGTCTLGQKGDSCTSNSQCCSNNCKGRTGRKTCK